MSSVYPDWIDEHDDLHVVIPMKVWMKRECDKCSDYVAFTVYNEDKEDYKVCIDCAEKLWKND